MPKPDKTKKTARKQPIPATKLPVREVMRPGAFTEAELKAAWADAYAPVHEELRKLSAQLSNLGVKPLPVSPSSELTEDAIKEFFPDLPYPEIQSQYRALSKRVSQEEFIPLMAHRREREEAGAAFRKLFKDMTPADINRYLREYRGPLYEPIDVWWLVGFSGDHAMMRVMSERAKRPRPAARRGRKWNEQIRAVAEKAYREWIESANEPHPAWHTSWREFAKLCIDLIKRETGVDVPEDALRRSILPARNFPRPE